MAILLAISISTLALIPTLSWGTPNHYLNMSVSDSKRCFVTNGIPDHPTGKFPNRGNPNPIQEQRVNVCIPVEPVKGDIPTQIQGTMGIAINGVQFRPNTAGYWDPRAKRGHSRTGDKTESRYLWRARKTGS